jgi:putative MATE family efflux protein
MQDAIPEPTLGSSIREALRGSEQDYTTGPVGRSILLLAIPMVLEMSMESIFAVVDIFFVSRLGADAVAAVGLTESLLMPVYALAMGLAIGATALVARRIGERDAEGAARAAVQSLLLALAVSVVLGALGAVYAPRLLALMGASAGVIEIGGTFARVMLGGEAAIILLFVVNAIFRGAGDAAIAMRVLWGANALNMALAPCLIFGLGPFPRLGVTGAAIATTFGRSAGAAYAIWRLTRPGGRVPVRRGHLRPEPALMAQIARLSGSAAVQSLVGTASWIGLVRIISSFGSAALAGYTIGIRVVIFALLPSFGMSNAAATMVGQALGAGSRSAPRRPCGRPASTTCASWVASARSSCSSPPPSSRSSRAIRPSPSTRVVPAHRGERLPLLRLRDGAHAVVQRRGRHLHPHGHQPGGLLALGDPAGLRARDPLGLGPRGVFWSITIAFSTLAVVSAILFRRGRWKTRKL